jgi:pimeloyl-ACP methyl ester carboxylesterase
VSLGRRGTEIGRVKGCETGFEERKIASCEVCQPVSERIVQANRIDLCTESFGDPSDPALLLIMGAMASMLWWPEALCRQLAERGRFVVRYDNRDTGRSVTYEPGQPGYTLDDLADDAAGVLDAYEIQHAHLIGMSLGGMIAQLTALKHSARVASLTLIASSVFGPDNPDLPPMDPKILAYHRSGAELNWSDEAAVIDYMVGGWRLLSGSAHPFDEPAIRAIATGEVKRATNLLSMFNHALLAGGERWYGKIGEIRAPALVIHGTDDPVLPYPHGLALARTIPGAKLLTLNGTGHELHPADWNTITDAILEQTPSR